MALIQKATTFDTVGLGTVVSGTFSSFVRPGDTIVLAYNIFSGTIVNISDTQSNTYALAGTAINGSDRSYIYYVSNTTGGSVVTTIQTSSAHVSSMGLYEYNGILVASPFDKTSSGSALASTNCTPGTFTPANNNSLVVALGGDFVAGGTAAVTPATGYTLQSQQDGITGERFYYQDFTQAVSGTTSGSFTLANAANNRAVQVAFKPVNTPLVSTLSDNFNAGTLDTTKWNLYTANGGTAAIVSNQLQETPAPATNASWGGVYSVNQYNLVASQASLQIVASGSANTFLDLTLSTQPLPSDNFISIGIDTGLHTLQAGDEINGAFTIRNSVAYNPVTMQFVRIRENGGTVFFDYSQDGNTWTNLDNRVPAVSINSLYVVLDDFEYNALGTPGVAILDNFNIIPTPGVPSFSRRTLLGVGI